MGDTFVGFDGSEFELIKGRDCEPVKKNLRALIGELHLRFPKDERKALTIMRPQCHTGSCCWCALVPQGSGLDARKPQLNVIVHWNPKALGNVVRVHLRLQGPFAPGKGGVRVLPVPVATELFLESNPDRMVKLATKTGMTFKVWKMEELLLRPTPDFRDVQNTCDRESEDYTDYNAIELGNHYDNERPASALSAKKFIIEAFSSLRSLYLWPENHTLFKLTSY